jgi:valyl-tRNA synthetase
MRYTIVNITPLGQNLLLSMDKFNTGARFANKIWNASRYILMNVEGIPPGEPGEEGLDTIDRWIETVYQQTVQRMNQNLKEYRLNEASSVIYEFFWHEFCDWYIEMSKVKLYGDDEVKRSQAAGMLLRILEGSLRLLHPLMPFITEEIWQRLPLKKEHESIMIADYPLYKDIQYAEEVRTVTVLKEIVYTIRNIRGEMHVPPDLKASVLVKGTHDNIHGIIEDNRDVIEFLAGLSSITCGGQIVKPAGSASAVGSGYEVYLPLKGLIDFGREKARLEKDRVRLQSELVRSSEKLQNADFVNKAPQDVVTLEKDRLKSFKENIGRVKNLLASLEE